MAKTSPKARPATSEPKTLQGQRQTSYEKITVRKSDAAGDMPHEQERGETKSRPGARDVKQRLATGDGRNVQQEKKGKMRPMTGAIPEKTGGQVTKPKGRGKAKRRPRLGKSTHAGSRKSRSPSTRKDTRSSATAP